MSDSGSNGIENSVSAKVKQVGQEIKLAFAKSTGADAANRGLPKEMLNPDDPEPLMRIISGQSHRIARAAQQLFPASLEAAENHQNTLVDTAIPLLVDIGRLAASYSIAATILNPLITTGAHPLSQIDALALTLAPARMAVDMVYHTANPLIRKGADKIADALVQQIKIAPITQL